MQDQNPSILCEISMNRKSLLWMVITDLESCPSLESSEVYLLVGGHGEWALNGDRTAALGTSNLIVGRGNACGAFLKQTKGNETRRKRKKIRRDKYAIIVRLLKDFPPLTRVFLHLFVPW